MKFTRKTAAISVAALLGLAAVGNALPDSPEPAPAAPTVTATTSAPAPAPAPAPTTPAPSPTTSAPAKKAAKWTHAFKTCEDLHSRWWVVSDKDQSPNMAADRRVVVMDTLGLRGYELGCQWAKDTYGNSTSDYSQAETE